MNAQQIVFIPKDYHYPHLDAPVREMAYFLFSHRDFIVIFFSFTQQCSCCNLSNYNDIFKIWKQHFKEDTKLIFNPNDVTDFFKLIFNLLKACRRNWEFSKIRGLVPEKLLEKIFTENFTKPNWVLGFGCAVSILKKDVIYRDTPDISTLEKKQTVDVGAWSEKLISGKFLEIKLSPNSFDDKDAYYLEKLDTELSSIKRIKKIIYVVTFESTALAKRQVDKKRNDLHIKTNIKVIGRDDIFNEFC